MAEVITAPDGRKETRFVRPPEAERFTDFQHRLFAKIARPHGLTDKQIAEELRPFVDALDSVLAEQVGTSARAERQTADLLPEPRAAKIAEAISEPVNRLQRVTAKRMTEAQTSIEAAESRLRASIQRPKSEDQIAELRQDLQLSEIRSALKGLSESAKIAAAMRAAQAGDLSMLWALDGAPFPLVKPETLQEISRRIAAEREPWRQSLVEYRRDVHRAALELTASTHQFIGASLGRLEKELGLGVAKLAPLSAFMGETEAPALAITTSAPAKQRTAA